MKIPVRRELKILNPESDNKELTCEGEKSASVLGLALHSCAHTCVCTGVGATHSTVEKCPLCFTKSSIQPHFNKSCTLIIAFANTEMTSLRPDHLRKLFSIT